MALREVKISVIMACYNSAPYLEEAIDSIVGQTFTEWELLAIDDCSTDNTLSILKKYQQRDSRIVIIRLDRNSGVATARNKGIENARGQWLSILDSDDVAMPTRLEEQYAASLKHENATILLSDAAFIDVNGRLIKEYHYPSDHKSLVRRIERRKVFPPHSSMMYPKAAVVAVGGFNPLYVLAQDHDLWLRLLEKGELFSVPKVLVKIRKHGDSISNMDAGEKQLIHSFAGSICHFLRIAGNPTPADGDAACWGEFISWLKVEMNRHEVLKKYKIWQNASQRYFAGTSRLQGLFSCACYLLSSRYATVLLYEKLFGFKLSRRLADEWMKGNAHKIQSTASSARQ